MNTRNVPKSHLRVMSAEHSWPFPRALDSCVRPPVVLSLLPAGGHRIEVAIVAYKSRKCSPLTKRKWNNYFSQHLPSHSSLTSLSHFTWFEEDNFLSPLDNTNVFFILLSHPTPLIFMWHTFCEKFISGMSLRILHGDLTTL